MKVLKDPSLNRNMNIHSGEMHVSGSGQISIVLGSCVSVIIYDPVLKIGGANHFLIPSRAEMGARPDLNKLHYGDESIVELLKEFKKRGSAPENLIVKLVGGSGERGKLNIEIAEAVLRRFQMNVENCSVGGDFSRRVQFNTATGDLRFKYLNSQFEDLEKGLKTKAHAITKLVSISKEAVGTEERIPRPRLILIGSSTGGTQIVKSLLMSLEVNCPPVLVVQHIPQQFVKSFVESLNLKSKIEVKEAVHGEILKSGNAYVAPGAKHLACVLRSSEMVIQVLDDPPVNRFKPSVDYLFSSVSKFDSCSRVLAIILTGMGQDGANGMLELKEKGAYTIGQNEETCLVYGMSRVASEIGATRLMASPIEIIDFMTGVLSDSNQ